MSVATQRLREKCLTEGQNLGDGILKIDSFLNHQIDPQLMMEIGKHIGEKFANAGATRILSAEVSGIAPAMAAGFHLGIPVVYARKTKPVTMSGPVFLETARSRTKGREVNLLVSAEFLPANERILIIDDFLASGKTLLRLVSMVREAQCELVGISCVVEKQFEGGRDKLEKFGVPVETLLKIASMSDGGIQLADE